MDTRISDEVAAATLAKLDEPLVNSIPLGEQPTEQSVAPYRTGWLVGVIAMMVFNAGVTAWLLARPARQPTIVAFDMKGTLDQFLTQSASQSLSESQSMQLAERFSTALDASLNDYQQAHQALILVSPSVVRGAPDITLTIQQDIAARMRAVAPTPAPGTDDKGQP